jgi:hypothetical protein
MHISSAGGMGSKLRIVEIMGLSILVISNVMLPFLGNHSFLATASQPSFLADRHKLTGIGCEGCHKENPPKEQVPTVVCGKCHGDQAKLANRTQKVIPNPHDSHLGNVECGLCHHAHKPSEDYCGNCHEFGYKVP